VRARIFRVARDAHARAQKGGSGVDVAASVYGGVLRYAITEDQDMTVRAVELPAGLIMAAFDSGCSVRTSDMLARVDALRARGTADRIFAGLRDAADDACASVDRGNARAFIASAVAFGSALSALGLAADAPIVPPAWAELASLAEHERAAFLPSGAGGGDVAVWLGLEPPSADFVSRAGALSMRPLVLRIDRGGLRPESLS
jgi:phosphomevalonate kinase